MIREGGDKGFLGRYVSDPTVVIEACFSWHPDLKKFGNTPLVSVIIARDKKCLFEWFNAATVKMPSREDAEAFVLPLINALSDYWPHKVSRGAR